MRQYTLESSAGHLVVVLASSPWTAVETALRKLDVPLHVKYGLAWRVLNTTKATKEDDYVYTGCSDWWCWYAL